MERECLAAKATNTSTLTTRFKISKIVVFAVVVCVDTIDTTSPRYLRSHNQVHASRHTDSPVIASSTEAQYDNSSPGKMQRTMF